MSRLTRINELLMREVSDLLHTRFRERTTGITITEVDITPDLRSAHVYFCCLGDTMARHAATQLLEEIKAELRTRISKRVILKYTPSLTFHYDDSLIRGNRTLAILDDLASKGEFKNGPAAPEPEDSESGEPTVEKDDESEEGDEGEDEDEETEEGSSA